MKKDEKQIKKLKKNKEKKKMNYTCEKTVENGKKTYTLYQHQQKRTDLLISDITFHNPSGAIGVLQEKYKDLTKDIEKLIQQRANIVNKIEAIQSMIDREESKRR